MRLIWSTYLLVCICHMVCAQQTPISSPTKWGGSYLKSGYVGASAGMSIPVGDYASTDIWKYASGYATSGFSWQLDAGYELLPYLGLQLSYMSQQNGIRTSALESDLNEVYAFQRLGIIEVRNFEASNYMLNGVTFGLYYPLRLPNLTIKFGATAGFVQSVFPEFNMIGYTSPNHPYAMSTSSANSNAMLWSAGISFRRKLVSQFLLIGSVQYAYTEQKFGMRTLFISTLATPHMPSAPQTHTAFSLQEYTQYYHMINAYLGIAYAFE